VTLGPEAVLERLLAPYEEEKGPRDHQKEGVPIELRGTRVIERDLFKMFSRQERVDGEEGKDPSRDLAEERVKVEPVRD
jgi:hypothetical protein